MLEAGVRCWRRGDGHRRVGQDHDGAHPVLALLREKFSPIGAECCVNRIKVWRGLVFRFDMTPGGYLAGLLRGAILWIRSLRPA
ncbi:hypothetical protein [Nonomuraea candida]|uniref:hypothetical protein n=1 Tax=Nonomuraea candida TaxID=359159 RepID=UPI0005BDFE34|nr:hypothetical protein [Nonomuraea candida]